eukprot:TRINITY_DN18114_c0_g1_i6.p1 TRINITY_DN18114_c0_g1~~TRINITY_DN18114_c0_g1_i6.p1  ORF type:complete len:218 (-),score=21.04 TRINITY_DN18114_c0_g1_i6:88-741(-)
MPFEQWPDFGCEGIKVQRAHQPTSQCQGKKKKIHKPSIQKSNFPNSAQPVLWLPKIACKRYQNVKQLQEYCCLGNFLRHSDHLNNIRPWNKIIVINQFFLFEIFLYQLENASQMLKKYRHCFFGMRGLFVVLNQQVILARNVFIGKRWSCWFLYLRLLGGLLKFCGVLVNRIGGQIQRAFQEIISIFNYTQIVCCFGGLLYGKYAMQCPGNLVVFAE